MKTTFWRSLLLVTILVAVSASLFAQTAATTATIELHIFQMGAHGFVNKGGGADHFMDRVAEWMRINGFLAPERAESSARRD